MKRIPEEKMYKGNIYKCISSWSVAGSYFGVPYKEELVCAGKTFVLLKDGSYVELEDLKNNGRKAIRYNNKSNKSGEYFVKDLTPSIKEDETESTL
ncbi:MAG: hypothetical protein IKC49_02475 [Clostridia bacterium]|nr:hypothetical protein [Clostridia bacterium]